MKFITKEELAKHGPGARQKWTAVNGLVYDVTSFAHPGGDSLVQQIMGKNGTRSYSRAHQATLIKSVLDSLVVGKYEGSEDEDVGAVEKAQDSTQLPHISTMINTFDFEAIAKEVLSKEAWAYYSSGADDEICLRENRAVFSRLRLKPRVLVNVRDVDTRTNLLGCASALPLYLSATALARLAHEDGEVAITRAAHRASLVYMLPTLSSCTVEEMLAARAPGQSVFSQLYVNTDRARTEAYCKLLRDAGRVEALFVTVDAPQLGRREKDMRMKFGIQANVQRNDANVPKNEGVTRAISSFIDPSLSWEDIPWLKSLGMPIVLKGIQCVEDALLAFQHGVQGIVLSNHGGRQIDSARSGLEVLEEVMPELRKLPTYQADKFQVFIDGGIRRGADIFKALALGARAVGIGRPVLYSLASFGEEGIEAMVNIFRHELEMTMRLMGTPTIAHINESFVLKHALKSDSGVAARDFLAERLYEPLETQAQRQGFHARPSPPPAGKSKI